MPARARVGRKDRTKSNSTICFIRNDRRDAFYWIRSDGELEELSFVETAREFRADVPEKGIPLHEDHHIHISTAADDFARKIQDEAAKHTVVDPTQGPNEKKALAYLDGFLNLPFIGASEINLIKAAKQAVKLGRHQKLQRDINALKMNVKKTPLPPVLLLDAMLKIISNYPIEAEDTTDIRPTISIKSFNKLKPEIIISESYSYTK